MENLETNHATGPEHQENYQQERKEISERDKISKEKTKEINTETKIENSINENNTGLIEKLKRIAYWGFLFIGLYIALSNFPFFSTNIIDPKSGLIVIFLVGLLTSFHCIGMCGGFVISYASNSNQKGLKPHICYNGARILSYTLLGALLGLVGGFIAITDQIRGTLSFLAGLFMILYGLSIFYPKLRKYTILPSFIDIHKYSSNPAMFGFLNGFMPCGPLQAMLVYAAGTVSIIDGGLTMLVFGAGTVPLMFIMGALVSKISMKWTHKAVKIASVLIIVLGIIMLQRSTLLMGIGIPNLFGQNQSEAYQLNSSQQIQEIKMKVTTYGWEPDTFTVKKGIPVKWIITVEKLSYCNKGIKVPELGINYQFEREGEIKVFEFTPSKIGTIYFTCWMGMIPGQIIVK